ncbi:acyltransferase [Stenotrophomonas sp. Sm3119]|uniref:acyltransferase family protein n=1 Tax=Stenotrophomonas sp. Sm3119 TaxID=3002744 RepID=UPI0027E41D04|nr:acyltransferase [Stenotrophomonas sp. Sm3119]MDQ7306852.1 acyltransferase [Stenotrophomonas sp. Sm3119]
MIAATRGETALKLPVFGFGAGRFLLASLVAASHLWSNMPHGYAAYAVWAFFVLSGFLMTLVLTTKYGFGRAGIKAYAFNRFMRIFPLYWLAAIMGLATLWYYNSVGIDLRPINGEFHMPRTFEDWAYVITLFPGLQRGGMPVPVANALAIEVGFYLLLPLMATSRGAAVLGVVIGALLNLKLGINVPDTFGERYATFLPCLLPFATGALLCHFREPLKPLRMPWLSCTVWMLHGVVWAFYPSWPWTLGLYVSVLLSAWAVLSLHAQPAGKIDKMLGDMSYPVYLIHTTVAAWFVCACGFTRPFVTFFLPAFAATVVLSWLIVLVIDRPLSRLKRRPPAKLVHASHG